MMLGGEEGEGMVVSEDVAELRKRAQRNIVFKHFRLGEVNIYFSYSGEAGRRTPSRQSVYHCQYAHQSVVPLAMLLIYELRLTEQAHAGTCVVRVAGAKWGNLEDVDHLHLKLHPIVYSNKTYSAKEFLLRVRKDVILDLLSQVTNHSSQCPLCFTLSPLSCCTRSLIAVRKADVYHHIHPQVNRNFTNLGAFLQQSVAAWGQDSSDDQTTPGASTSSTSLSSSSSSSPSIRESLSGSPTPLATTSRAPPPASAPPPAPPKPPKPAPSAAASPQLGGSSQGQGQGDDPTRAMFGAAVADDRQKLLFGDLQQQQGRRGSGGGGMVSKLASKILKKGS
jgi:hypothetical protein